MLATVNSILTGLVFLLIVLIAAIYAERTKKRLDEEDVSQ